MAASALAACASVEPISSTAPTPASLGSDARGRPRVHTPCVVHAGEGRIETHSSGGPDGQHAAETRSTACYLNAECVAHHGVATEGDALAEIECVEKHCVCRIEFLEPRPSEVEFHFEAESECSPGEQAEKLLMERCVGQSKR